jgi:hypothetical protein
MYRFNELSKLTSKIDSLRKQLMQVKSDRKETS